MANVSPRSFLAPRRARGFTLIELMVVLAITAVILVYQAQRAKADAEDVLTTAAADNIGTLGKALAVYISSNTATLSSAANTAVTVATLQGATACGTASCLTSTFQPPAWSGGYTMRVRRLGASAPFQFEALACTSTGWQINGALRGDLVGAAVSKVGGAGAMTYDATSGAYPNRSGTPLGIANYPASNLPAQLCYFVSQSTMALDLMYLRTDGSNQMNAALNMGGNTINAAGTVNATSVLASGLVRGGSVTATGALSGGTLGVGGAATIGGAANVTGHITTNGGVTATGNIATSSGVMASGDITTFNNVVATNDVLITSLPARASGPLTSSLKSLAPKLVELYSHIVTYDGQVVPAPACPAGGTPQVFILPHVATGNAVGGSWGSEVRMSGAGPWTVIARDAQGYRIGINSPAIPSANFSAIVRTFCTF